MSGTTDENATLPASDAQITAGDNAAPASGLELFSDPPTISEPFVAPPVDPIVKRGRGRPKGSGKKSGPVTPEEVDAVKVQAKLEAEMLVHLNDTALAALSAGELPQADPGMREAYVVAIRDYLIVTGQPLPPWVGLSVMAIAYNSRLLAVPTFKERAFMAWNKVRGWFKK